MASCPLSVIPKVSLRQAGWQSSFGVCVKSGIAQRKQGRTRLLILLGYHHGTSSLHMNPF